MMKPQLLSTALLCGALGAALTQPGSPLTARSLTRSPRLRFATSRRGTIAAAAAGASGPQRQILLVAAGVLAKSGRVLLQQRSDPPQLAGLWEFPGGKVDPGETLEKALARELDEELAVKVDLPRHSWRRDARGGMERGRWRFIWHLPEVISCVEINQCVGCT